MVLYVYRRSTRSQQSRGLLFIIIEVPGGRRLLLCVCCLHIKPLFLPNQLNQQYIHVNIYILS